MIRSATVFFYYFITNAKSLAHFFLLRFTMFRQSSRLDQAKKVVCMHCRLASWVVLAGVDYRSRYFFFFFFENI